MLLAENLEARRSKPLAETPRIREELRIGFAEGRRRAWLFDQGVVESETQGEDGWTVILSSAVGEWGAFSYDETRDVLRVELRRRGAEITYNQAVPEHDSVVAAGPGLHAALLERTRAILR